MNQAPEFDRGVPSLAERLGPRAGVEGRACAHVTCVRACSFSICVLQIRLRFISPLKNLRRLGIKMITDIFVDWESHQFRTEEIEAVFLGAVWPQVSPGNVPGWRPVLACSPPVTPHYFGAARVCAGVLRVEARAFA